MLETKPRPILYCMSPLPEREDPLSAEDISLEDEGVETEPDTLPISEEAEHPQAVIERISAAAAVAVRIFFICHSLLKNKALFAEKIFDNIRRRGETIFAGDGL